MDLDKNFLSRYYKNAILKRIMFYYAQGGVVEKKKTHLSPKNFKQCFSHFRNVLS